MLIIPKYNFNPKKEYQGEYFVAEILKKINLSKKDYLLHSQNLVGGNRQVWSEIDFVVITERAILGIEVKSGPVKTANGKYYVYGDKNSQKLIYEKDKSPLVQAKDGLFKLREKWLKDYSQLKNIPFISIAILAKNQRRVSDFPEMQNEFCIYEEDLMHHDLLKEKINNAIDYYIKEVFTRTPSKLSEKNIEEIKDILRPEIDKSPVDTNAQIQSFNHVQHSLTKDQYKVIDYRSEQRRLLIDGGAGTGKTFLLLYLLKAESNRFNKIAIVSKAKRLLEFVRSQTTQIKNIDFINGSNINLTNNKYDLIYVDEAQDFCNQEDYFLLDTILSSGLENGSWRFFGDFENQFKNRDEFDLEVFELLKSHTENKNYDKLYHNVRNTPKIVGTLEAFSRARVGRSEFKGAGPEPRYISKDDFKKILCDNSLEIQDFSEVAILHHENYKEDDLLDILDCLKNLISKGATLTTFEDFKGMESNYVFIIGLDESADLQSFRDNFYKSVSRARVYCFYLTNGIVEKFKEESLRNE